MSSLEIVRSLPDEVVHLVMEKYASIRDRVLSPSEIALLAANNLAAQDGHVSKLCERLCYHAHELQRQEEPRRLEPMLAKIGADKNSVVLDVGCGAGQSLQLIHRRSGCKCYGIDCDLDSLAFGNRVNAAYQNSEIELRQGRGDAIEFESEAFSHVINRVALNYMHQHSALKEMVRVLKPGGKLYLQVENAGTDLRALKQSKSIREFASRSVELGFGFMRSLAGVQFKPGAFRGCPGRIFGSNRRIAKDLASLGCPVTDAQVLSRDLGIASGSTIVATKSL